MFDLAFEESFGEQIAPDKAENEMARGLIALLLDDDYPYGRLTAVYRSRSGVETVKFEVDVERPQKPVVAITRLELIAARFNADDLPNVFALRADFPTDALHLNLGIEGWAPWLCLDEKPWVEARQRWTPFRFAERIRWWLAATSRGELHAPDQPVEPLFAPDIGVIIPGEVFGDKWNDDRVLEVHSVYKDASPATIVLREGKPQKPMVDSFLPIFLIAKPQRMQALRSAPPTLERLDSFMQSLGIDLIAVLRDRSVRLIEHEAQRLKCRPLLLLHVPLLDSDGEPMGQADLKAFSTTVEHDFTQIGIDLGVFLASGDAESKFGPVARRVPTDASLHGSNTPVVLLAVYPNFSREVAAVGSGAPADTRSIALVGGGAIGSHVVEILRRDGFGTWTIIDNDALLPHNIQRHRLAEGMVGSAKAAALANYLNWITGTTGETKPLCADVLIADPATDAALQSASVIVDASASLPVARYLSDFQNAPGRRLSIFFNPRGSDVVLLGEDDERSLRLDALEAQYYRAILKTPILSRHLTDKPEGYRYALSCRSVSFKMPEYQVSMLAGAISGDIRHHLKEAGASLIVWVSDRESGIQRAALTVFPVTRFKRGDWEIVVDAGLVDIAVTCRKGALPRETGGILLGTIDVSRRQVCIVDVVPAPEDSKGSAEGFERGIKKLSAILREAAQKTAGQVEYVGEWHSHPEGAAPDPSGTDIKQLVWLGAERSIEGLPAVMMIVSDVSYTINLVSPSYEMTLSPSPSTSSNH